MDLINDLDLEQLEKELELERISFNDVANYVLNLNLDENIDQINLNNYQQNLKLIKISKILLKIAIDKTLLSRKSDNDKYIFQCTNCSKAFRKSEYLDNHFQRRHVTSSLAHDGLFPLIEQIKKYNSGLFVESSSIDDLKEEIKNLQSCLKDTSEDLIKEKIAREQLQRIIESEIIEKLNSLQETWSIEPTAKDEHEEKLKSKNNEELNENIDDTPNIQQLDKDNQLNDLKDTKDFNLFLIKQNELIDKLGKNIDRFVKENPNEIESKINNEQLQNLISTAIHKEIENLLSKDILTSKDKTINKPKNNRKFLLRKDNTKLNTKEKEIRRLSLHEFSIQPQLQQLENQNLSNNLNNINRNDHTDEIVHEINQIVNEDNLIKNITPIVKSNSNKRFKFPFKFRKSKSLNQLAINNEEIIQKNENESNLNENNSSVEVKSDLIEKKESEIKDESKVVNSKEESKKELNENNTDKKLNNDNNKPISRFRQFVSKRKDNEQDNKISLTKFSSKQLASNNQIKINEDVKDGNLDKQNDKQTNVKQLANQNDNKLQNGSKVLKSVLKKSNSTDNNSLQNQSNKLPKRIVFNDERVEFSAEELDSSDTGSSYSITNGINSNYNFSNSYLAPTQQVVTVQKVIEKPRPALRNSIFKQQQNNTLTSL